MLSHTESSLTDAALSSECRRLSYAGSENMPKAATRASSKAIFEHGIRLGAICCSITATHIEAGTCIEDVYAGPPIWHAKRFQANYN
jgi:hypothetical protein